MTNFGTVVGECGNIKDWCTKFDGIIDTRFVLSATESVLDHVFVTLVT